MFKGRATARRTSPCPFTIGVDVMRTLMRFYNKIILREAVKSLSYLLVVALLAFFMVISNDLSENFRLFLDKTIEIADVVALPSFYAHVSERGKPCSVEDIDYAGYLEVSAAAYDLDLLKDFPGVLKINANPKFGAYIGNRDVVFSDDGSKFEIDDVLVFRYNGDAPATIEGIARGKYSTEDALELDVEILWSSNNLEKFYKGDKLSIYNMQSAQAANCYADKVEELQLQDIWLPALTGESIDGSFVLQPGQEYIASVRPNFILIIDASGQVTAALLHRVGIAQDPCHTGRYPRYTGDDSFIESEWSVTWNDSYYPDIFPPLLPYYDGFWESEAGAFFNDAIEVAKINSCSVNAVLTDDIMSILPFHTEKLHISSGRNISEQEYIDGAKVCIISEYFAELNGIGIGDELDLSFFKSPYPYGGRASLQVPYYQPQNSEYGEFFDNGTFSVVGLYSGNVSKSGKESSSLQYGSLEGADRRDIFVPFNAVRNVPDFSVSKYDTLLKIDGTKAAAFEEAIEYSKLCQRRDDGYQVSFELLDNGFGKLASHLEELVDSIKTTKTLTTAISVIVVFFLFLIHIHSSEKNMATAIALGVPRRNSYLMVVYGVVLPAIIGGAVGMISASLSSVRIAEVVMRNVSGEIALDGFMLNEMPIESLFAISTYSASVYKAAIILIVLLIFCTAVFYIFNKNRNVLKLSKRK